MTLGPLSLPSPSPSPSLAPRRALSVRAAAWAVIASIALGSAACGSRASAPPAPASDARLGQSAAPAVGPMPVPATFDVAALSEQVRPLVVNITTTSAAPEDPEDADPFDFFFGPRGRPAERGGRKRVGLGTGFVIDKAGYIVTNEHVVEGATEVQVRFADEREFTADVVGRDPKLDLALLRVEGVNDLPAAPLGSSEALRVGEHVLAVGNPFGLGHTVTLGIVSAKARTIGAGPYDDFIQTDASINPGNSGGPLFNWRGEVVGINSAIRAGASGIGFAIPIDALKDVLPQLRERGFVERGRLGVAFQAITPALSRALGLPSTSGALVSEVEPNGPASRAGIRPGDVIVEVARVAVVHATELPRAVARHRPGSALKLGLVRDKQRKEATVTLDRLEDEAAARPPRGPKAVTPAHGESRPPFVVADAPNGGVVVTAVTEGGAAKELAPGDVIVEAAGVPVRNTVELRAALAKVKAGSVGLLKVRRGQATRFVALPAPAAR